MLSNISKLLRPFGKRALLLLVCLVPFVGVLLAFLNYLDLRIIYALQSIPPLCVLITIVLGINRRDISFLQFNLVFVLPYSLLSVSILRKFFDLQNISVSLLIVLSYLMNTIILNLFSSLKEKYEHEKHKYAFWRICFSFYLLPLVIYNISFFLNDFPYKTVVFAMILTPNILFYSGELLKSYHRYTELKIEGEAGFLENWYIALPFSLLSNMFYTLYSLEGFQSRGTARSLTISSVILLSITLFLDLPVEKDVEKAYLALMLLVSVCQLYLGIIVYSSFLARFYEKIKFLMYFGFLSGVFFIIEALPSDFLPEISFVAENTDAILFSLSTIIQSLAAVLAISTTFITFVFIYVLTGRREEGKKATSEVIDLVLLTFLLDVTLALGCRLVKIILSALTAMGIVQSNISDLSFILTIIRDSQASFCMIPIYLLIVGCVLIIYHIRYRFEWSKIEEFIPELVRLIDLFCRPKE